MAFDGFFTKKMVEELNNELQYARINKINNISNSEFIFTVRKNKTKKLFISTDPKSFRIQLTEQSYENPKSPSNICTVLRKYLTNGYILSFEQINNDRIILINIKNSDELGYEKQYYLIVELMGKHSNIILTDKDKLIIDALKNSYSIEYSRSTIANSKYVLPPTKERFNPFECNFNEISLNENTEKNLLIKTFYGVSKNLETFLKKENNIICSLENFCEQFNSNFEPTILKNDNTNDFYFTNIYSDKNIITDFKSLSVLLDYYYSQVVSNQNTVKNKELITFIKNKINRLLSKISILNDEYEKTLKDNTNQLKGQLLLANNYLYKKNVPEEVVLQNFYDENLNDITIKLDSTMSIEQNAERFFNNHKKNKRTLENIEKQLKLSEQELSYFENLELQIEYADISDIEEIVEELNNNGYLKIKQKKKNKNKKTKYTIIEYNHNAIYVGKNNIQNDSITNKLANRNYLWFHAKNIPGSHVVIFSPNPDEETIKVAAMLAGYFSKMKNEDFVEVEYTQIKYVKKISGAKPGMVTYTNQKTIKIELDRKLITTLL